MHVFKNPNELRDVVGQSFGPGDWVTIDQAMIDAFAEATGDKQWIHVDVERARREAPGGKTIAHGYLTLSLIGTLLPTIYHVEAPRILNYGIDKLRFLNMVPVDSRLRVSNIFKSVEDTPQGALRVISQVTIEIEGQERPALVADIIFLYFA